MPGIDYDAFAYIFFLTLVYVYVRPISARPAVTADKTILCTSLNHFISKVVHDKFPFVCEVVANDCLPNLLLRMRRNGYDCTSASNVECKIKYSVPRFVQSLNFCQFGRVLDHFVRMRSNGHFQCKIWLHIRTLRARFPISREILEIGPQFQVFFSKFSAAHAQKWP